MVIGYDGSRAFLDQKTGTENYSFEILRHLIALDKDNYYVIFTRPGSRISKEKINELMSSSPRNLKLENRVEERFINYSRLWTQVGLSKQTFSEKLDVLFIPAHTLPVFRNPSLKTVVTVHDLGSEYLPQMHQLKQRLYLSFMQKVQLKSATKIIAVSSATKKDLVKKIGLTEKKIEVVFEGYNKNLFKPIKSHDTLVNSLRQLGLTPKNYLVYVGTIQPRKNLVRLIKAFNSFIKNQKSSKTILAIAGGKGWLSDNIYSLPKELGIEDRVKFLGRVEDAMLPYIYNGAIAFVYPSLFEGFGLPILEAQACGCPVLTSKVSSMPEVVGDSGILVDPYDQNDIERGLYDIVNEKESERLIKKGFENLKRFSWEKAALQTLKVLEEAAK